jgi:hypothetical protein
MKIIRLTLIILLSLLSTYSFADEAKINGNWQWNNNVKIDFIYGYWKNGNVQVHMDNGQFCYLKSEEKELLSIILAMRAQNVKGEIVCYKTPDKSVDGKDSRHIHRVRY